MSNLACAWNRKRRRPGVLVPLVLSFFLLPMTAIGQGANQGGKEAGVQAPSDAAALYQEYTDTVMLRLMNPLKLNAEQIQNLIETLAEAEAEYKKRFNAEVAPLIRKSAETIKTARRLALSGADVVGEEAVAKAIEAYLKKGTDLDTQTLKSLSEKCVKIFSKQQYAAASKIAREELAKAQGREANGSEAQFFNLYVRQAFINYPRIQPLLKDMKAARSGKDSAGNG